MTDTVERPPLPDRLSADTRSPHYVATVFEHEIGIRLNDNERKDVEEYCISEGKLTSVDVELGLERNGQAEIHKGLAGGERVGSPGSSRSIPK